jgi:aspartate racemase
VGLLDTTFTIEQDFYKGGLAHKHGLDMLVSEASDRATVRRVIYEELVQGHISDTSRQAYRKVTERLVARSAEAIILGRTETMLLVASEGSPVPLYDTTRLCVEAEVIRALCPPR